MTTQTQRRTCQGENCNADISHRYPKTQYCQPCAIKRSREKGSAYMQKVRTGQQAIQRPSTQQKIVRNYCAHYYSTTARTEYEDDDGARHYVCIPCWRKMLDD